ncbi:hypothetical protein J2X69_001073 [Algoriphagus sp. 4150]|nr:hypothetical protein [Algoriphagus sp. 4150]
MNDTLIDLFQKENHFFSLGVIIGFVQNISRRISN